MIEFFDSKDKKCNFKYKAIVKLINNKTNTMKTKISLIVGISFVVLLLASCGAGRKISCPAYGQVDNVEQSDLASR